MKTAPLLALAAVLAACSDPTPTATTAADNRQAEAAAASPIVLQPLPENALASLRGELRCAFEADGRSLLIAAADADRTARATAVVNVDGAVRSLEAASPGGFDALGHGGRFAGGDWRVAVVLGAEQPTGHEGSRHAATLSVTQGAREGRADGVWNCGP